jgi:hypothetical protein
MPEFLHNQTLSSFKQLCDILLEILTKTSLTKPQNERKDKWKQLRYNNLVHIRGKGGPALM